MSILDTILGFLHLGSSASKVASEVDNITNALGFLQPLNEDFAAFHKAWIDKSVQEEIVAGASVLEMFLKVASIIWPQATLAEKGVEVAAIVLPQLYTFIVKFGAQNVVKVANANAPGGFVYLPAHGQSLYDPKTGVFTGKYT